MTIKEIRLANLRALIAQYGSVSALAELVGTNPDYISQMTGKTDRGMGTRFARKAEVELKLPEGWLDTEHKPETPPVAPMDRHERELLEAWRKLPPLIRGHFTALMRQAALPLSDSYIRYEEDQQRRNRLHASRKKRQKSTE